MFGRLAADVLRCPGPGRTGREGVLFHAWASDRCHRHRSRRAGGCACGRAGHGYAVVPDHGVDVERGRYAANDPYLISYDNAGHDAYGQRNRRRHWRRRRRRLLLRGRGRSRRVYESLAGSVTVQHRVVHHGRAAEDDRRPSVPTSGDSRRWREHGRQRQLRRASGRRLGGSASADDPVRPVPEHALQLLREGRYLHRRGDVVRGRYANQEPTQSVYGRLRWTRSRADRPSV